MENLQEDADLYGYLNSENIMELISSNYERKPLEELSDNEMERFFQIRAEIIHENLVLDTKVGYTDEEIEDFMDRAESLSTLSMEYAEGWKALAEKDGELCVPNCYHYSGSGIAAVWT